MKMLPSIAAIRSIGADFALRLYLPVTITVGVVAIVLLAISIWLATISLWWLILVLLLFIFTLLAIAALVVVLVIIKTVTPEQSKAQKQQTKALVDKLLRVAEVTGTPKFILLFQVVKDVINPSQRGFIASISNDTTSLKRDFVALKDSFQ